MTDKMGKVEKQIQDLAAEGIRHVFNADLPADEIQVQRTRKDFEGEFTIVVFPISQLTNKSPEETANALGEFMVDNSENIEAFNVVKGFLNLKLRSAYWVDRLSKMLTEN